MRVLRTIGLTLGVIVLVFAAGGFAFYRYQHRTIHETVVGQNYTISADKTTLNVSVRVGTSSPTSLSWKFCAKTSDQIKIEIINSYQNSTTSYVASAKNDIVHVALPGVYQGQEVLNCNGSQIPFER